ncbi:MAG: bifunctional folylpolyglutamate synthase/dihydrofolate synthase [Candidatus Electronema sp. V4]|uniref:bifunctional folylpolyglutamate synthase/dihydrofolate synthase n=1 Tax=Candidatus Electronema sp. V4 TaxID=3454756 RepID=UPI0040555B71
MNCQQAQHFLDQLQLFKIKLGLDSMQHFLARLGDPQLRLRCVHIAGTNGKGSVGAALHAMLTAAGYKTGFYTSPHLNSVRERFQISGTYISKEDFARLMSRIESVLDGRQITYFECTTALALLWFAEQQTDFAVLEVGMGGRLDATNVVTPLVSVITNVSMDHEQHLGDTLAKIAAEKAGIIKPGVPVVSAVAEDESGRVIRETCAEQQAPLYLFGRDFSGSGAGSFWDYQGLDGLKLTDLPMPLRGGHQISNCSLALAAAQLLQRQGWPISEAQIRSGLAQTRWPGRLEYFRSADRQFLLDGAHNPAGAAALRDALRNEFPRQRLILVWGAMADKDIQTTLREVALLADRIILTKAADSERAASPEQLAAVLPEQLRAKACCTASTSAALDQARAMAAENDLICVSGSLYLIGAARELLLGGLTDAEE